MRRIRQGVATEAYWASTVRERNEAGADAPALECHRFYELKHQGRRMSGRSRSRLHGTWDIHACLDTWPSMAFGRYAALTTRPDLMHAVQA